MSLKICKMSQNTIKIYDSELFPVICKGLKVADCMKNSDDYQQDAEQTLLQMQTLAISDTLFCSFCQESFSNVSDQRMHYKLEWHRYNLKRKLIAKHPLSKDQFLNRKCVTTDDLSDSNSEEELCAKIENRNSCENEDNSSESEGETSEQYDKNQQLVLLATKHCQVFFCNQNMDLFSMYRCLLHPKKATLSDDELVEAANQWNNNSQIAVILVGGGHFAGAIFKGENVLVHKTFHCYTVRQGQGGAQGTRDNKGSAPKSAGASLRRYNEAALVQHVQDIMVTWALEMSRCRIILYRASGPYNRQVLFSGKSPAMDKTDCRLRHIPFPTKRATFNEVKRVYDIITTLDMNKNIEARIFLEPSPRDNSPKSAGCQERRSKSISPKKTVINRAKSREMPKRPSPCDISASESDREDTSVPQFHVQNQEINLKSSLDSFNDTIQNDIKNKKKPKKKQKHFKPKVEINEEYHSAKQKFWSALKLADVELLKCTLHEINTLIESAKDIIQQPNNKTFLWTVEGLLKLLNDTTNNCNKNTLLHLAVSHGQLDIVSELLKAGSDPCIRNLQGKTPYCMSDDCDIRNVFKKFRAENPDKYNYAKSHIPEFLSENAAMEKAEKRREIKRAKREREKIKKKEEAERKFDEDEKIRFIHLSDREKRALAAERRILSNPGVTSTSTIILTRCFTCGTDISGKVPFEYNHNRFCTMDCLKAHRLSKPVKLS